MSGFNLKPKGQQSSSFSDAPKVDYNAINEQVEADNQPAIISLIVDLGVHTPPENVSDKNETEFDTEEEAQAYLKRIVEIKGEKDAAKFKITQVGGKFVINGSIYQPKDGQEIAIFADLVDNVVDYGDEIGKKPYRIGLNKTWKGELKGFSLKAVPPQNGNVWTFAGTSMLTKLANATKETAVIDGSDANKLNDVGCFLGKSIMADIQKSEVGENTYVNLKGIGSVPKAIEKGIDYSLVTPVGISFDTATVEDLKAACLRGNILKKIKSANNYAGSQIEKAIKELEGDTTPSQPKYQESVNETSNDYDDDDF